VVTEFERNLEEKSLSRETIPIESLEHDLVLVRSKKKGKHPRWLEIDGLRFTPPQLDYLRLITEEGLQVKEAAERLGRSSNSVTGLLKKLKESNLPENGILPTKEELAERASDLGLFNESSLTELKNIFK